MIKNKTKYEIDKKISKRQEEYMKPAKKEIPREEIARRFQAFKMDERTQKVLRSIGKVV